MAPWRRARGQWWSILSQWAGRWHQSRHWKCNHPSYISHRILRVLDANKEMWRSRYLYSHTGSPFPRSHLMVGIMDTGASFQCKFLDSDDQLRRIIGSNERKEFNFLFECFDPVWAILRAAWPFCRSSMESLLHHGIVQVRLDIVVAARINSRNLHKLQQEIRNTLHNHAKKKRNTFHKVNVQQTRQAINIISSLNNNKYKKCFRCFAGEKGERNTLTLLLG